MQKHVKNSELRVPKERRELLSFKNVCLVPCGIEENEEGVTFTFASEGLEPAERVSALPAQDKLRFLLNCASLAALFESYDVDLDPGNIMIDLNLRPRIIMRDIKADENFFLPRYKALIGAVLQGKSYEDFLKGHKRMFKKNSLLERIAGCESAAEIADILLEQYQKISAENNKTKTLVKKSALRRSRTVIPLLSVLLAATLTLLYINAYLTVPYQERVIAAAEAYIFGDYLGVAAALAPIAAEDLNETGKFILARSFVMSEGLRDDQRENVLRGLTANTDPFIFDYWIHMGRLNVDAALDIGGRLGDDDLLLFAYLKKEILVKNDTALSGAEKTALLDELDGKIKALTEARDKAAAD